jgi:hypothetical protein
VLQEKTYSVQVSGIEEEVVTDANEVVMPEYGERERNAPETLQLELPQQEVRDRLQEWEMAAEKEMPIETGILSKHELQSEQDSEIAYCEAERPVLRSKTAAFR